MELITSRLALREFNESDFVFFRELEAHPKTYYYESTFPDEVATRKYLGNARADALQTPRIRYRFAVTLRPDDEVRGRVTLGLMNDSIQEWEIGWAVHPAKWGKGIAVEAAHRLMEFAFVELRAHRIVAFCHAQNDASLRVMEKLGMQKDGHLRETRRWQGRWADEAVFSNLEWEWC